MCLPYIPQPLSFVTSSSDFQIATIMPPQIPVHKATTVQNLTMANHEAVASAVV